MLSGEASALTYPCRRQQRRHMGIRSRGVGTTKNTTTEMKTGHASLSTGPPRLKFELLMGLLMLVGIEERPVGAVLRQQEKFKSVCVLSYSAALTDRSRSSLPARAAVGSLWACLGGLPRGMLRIGSARWCRKLPVTPDTRRSTPGTPCRARPRYP